jgi:phosphoribosyl 1,2-cyclic phosphodiesterase
MSNFAFCVLGSGSRGNCSLLKTSETKWIMIDSGFSMRQTKERMRTHNICMDDVSDLLLTHLDRDHFNPVWCRSLLNRGIYVHLHESHVERGIRAGLDHSILKPFTTSIDFESLHVETLHLAHDALGTVGFVFNHLECKTRFGFATDLGRVPKTLLDAFKSLDILAFESNYDPTMQRTSGRPDFLQDRIMGGGGHLSNEESLNAVKHIAENSNLQHIVLLHLSKQCNSPAIIRDLYHDNLAHLYNCVTITDQDRCSRLLRFEKQPTSLF